MTITEKLHDLNSQVLQGKAMDAFETYYAESISMQENNNPPTIGKEANRKRELDFFASLTAFNGAEILDYAVNDDTSYVTWKLDYVHKDWGHRNYTQVNVQKWQNGKIIKEQFFYGN